MSSTKGENDVDNLWSNDNLLASTEVEENPWAKVMFDRAEVVAVAFSFSGVIQNYEM